VYLIHAVRGVSFVAPWPIARGVRSSRRVPRARSRESGGGARGWGGRGVVWDGFGHAKRAERGPKSCRRGG